MQSLRRPRLTPAIADLRRAVREQLPASGLVLVGLSGGADSLALAAATAFEAARAGLGAGAVIVDHGLQAGSAGIAQVAAEQAADLGLDPVLIVPVTVTDAGGNGPEAAARTARYAAFDSALAGTGAVAVLLGHTLDDQAETVLLGLARGSGARSLQGMAAISGRYRRPLLGIRRAQTRQACLDAGLTAWADPQNADPRYARVRVRSRVLPVLETELGPGVAQALARTADVLREDADALDALVPALVAAALSPAGAGSAVSVDRLAAQPAAIVHRMIRAVVAGEFGVTLERDHTLAVARLVTHWHGQNALDLPGVRVERQGGTLVFSAPRPTQNKGPFRSHGTS
ncbi:tRNA lysidine(34) synthetase TilS [Cryobacterium sp.]|jgi:tRNA(Ile)-lysidine synthase|uniref:tRNA lysidine(34) synthetase TilS n=1 Tax=Cryobacterium sp. TaxID=1926290 RepID=UPI0026341758|nr:tRNA lysidine(34) synthetase TilS [Cryobacterium sp.]MCU1447176.1 tRNA(Ile)-lysidine synthetase [Cryobacterium sp.]